MTKIIQIFTMSLTLLTFIKSKFLFKRMENSSTTLALIAIISASGNGDHGIIRTLSEPSLSISFLLSI